MAKKIKIFQIVQIYGPWVHCDDTKMLNKYICVVAMTMIIQ